MAMDILQTKGREIVDQKGNAVHLRGTNIGSWMNMEYYIHGLYGSEHILRMMSREILGPEKAAFVFDSMLDHFFNEKDVKFLKMIGTTVIRVALNYHHFEDDSHPFVYLESGFKRLDDVLSWCEKYGMYVIIDLHAAAGWQSGGWHCDNALGEAQFWNNGYFLDRFVRLWEEFARRYKGRGVVAGYNLLNEPATTHRIGNLPLDISNDWDALNLTYRKTVEAIRKIDPDHIIFLEGDNHSRLFSGLEPPFAANLAYSSHNYSFGGITAQFYPGVNPAGDYWDVNALRKEFYEQEGTQFCEKHNVPLWIGEFGSRTYSELLDDQIGVFEEFGAHWTMWQHKDCGFSSLLRYRPDCEYYRRFGDLLDRIGTTYGGISGKTETPERTDMRRKCREFEESMLAAAKSPYLVPATHYMLARWVDDGYYAKILLMEFVKRLEKMSLEEIDGMFESFEIDNCIVHPFVRAVQNHCS